MIPDMQQTAQPEPLDDPRPATEPLSYARAESENTHWRYMRGGMIVYSSLGIARFVLSLPTDLTYVFSAQASPFFLVSFVGFTGFVCLLVGAIATKTVIYRGSAITIGTGLLVLSAVILAVFGGRAYFVKDSLVLGLQQAVLPAIALAILSDAAAQTGGHRWAALGEPFHLLLASQIPAALGMAWLIAILVGLASP